MTTPSEKPAKNRNVIWLGLVSLFTDLSSQMIYPLVPAFLETMGVSKTVIGLVEGIAEATASLFKTVSGWLSDRYGKRKWFVFVGYGLSAISKPFLFFATVWGHVMGVRFTDRMGKAIRNPARDALISSSVDKKKRGKAFGFHRAMDRLGAVGGPLLALLILKYSDENLRLVFLLAGIPAVIALVFIPFTREAKQALPSGKDLAKNVKQRLTSRAFVVFLIANIVFTLGNSSNAFLILKATETGISLMWLPVLWVAYNLVATVSAPIFGSLSDKIGRKPVIVTSFIFYAALYVLFAFADVNWEIWMLFAGYGVYYGLSKGVFKAYIADLVPAEQRGTAYGVFNTGIGLALLPASLMMGFVWDLFGSQWAFLVSAGFSLVGFLIYVVGVRKPESLSG